LGIKSPAWAWSHQLEHEVTSLRIKSPAWAWTHQPEHELTSLRMISCLFSCPRAGTNSAMIGCHNPSPDLWQSTQVQSRAGVLPRPQLGEHVPWIMPNVARIKPNVPWRTPNVPSVVPNISWMTPNVP
jgi:hypothetical protein